MIIFVRIINFVNEVVQMNFLDLCCYELLMLSDLKIDLFCQVSACSNTRLAKTKLKVDFKHLDQ